MFFVVQSAWVFILMQNRKEGKIWTTEIRGVRFCRKKCYFKVKTTYCPRQEAELFSEVDIYEKREKTICA